MGNKLETCRLIMGVMAAADSAAPGESELWRAFWSTGPALCLFPWPRRPSFRDTPGATRTGGLGAVIPPGPVATPIYPLQLACPWPQLSGCVGGMGQGSRKRVGGG